MQSMTYGQLPSRDAFTSAFDIACPCGTFAIGNCHRVGTADFSELELWDELTIAAKVSTDESLDWCACVLSVLGIEWI